VRAEELPDEEAAAFWPRVLQAAPDYARYPRRTSRRTPLLRLVPATPATASDTAGASSPWRPAMARIEGEIMINRPVEEVFDFVADERNEPRYNPRMVRAEMLSPGPVGLGSRFRAEMRTRPRLMVMEAGAARSAQDDRARCQQGSMAEHR
jgi:hypothetical protein